MIDRTCILNIRPSRPRLACVFITICGVTLSLLYLLNYQSLMPRYSQIAGCVLFSILAARRVSRPNCFFVTPTIMQVRCGSKLVLLHFPISVQKRRQLYVFPIWTITSYKMLHDNLNSVSTLVLYEMLYRGKDLDKLLRLLDSVPHVKAET